MSDEWTTPELVAAYRDRERPAEAARERMAAALMAAAAERSATVIPLRPPARRGRTIRFGWLAVAAALALIGGSSYWLVGARHQAERGPADMLMDPQSSEPAQGIVAPKASEQLVRAADSEAAPREEQDSSDSSEQQSASDSGERAASDSSEQRAASDSSEQQAASDSREEAAGDSREQQAAGTADPAPRRPARDRRPVAADHPPARGEQGDPVLEELMLIQRIKDALDAGRPGEALAAIEAHAREFARGSLVEEREALRVVGLCGAGERERGERAQQAFVRAYPRSAYRERVRAACPVAASPEGSATID